MVPGEEEKIGLIIGRKVGDNLFQRHQNHFVFKPSIAAIFGMLAVARLPFATGNCRHSHAHCSGDCRCHPGQPHCMNPRKKDATDSSVVFLWNTSKRNNLRLSTEGWAIVHMDPAGWPGDSSACRFSCASQSAKCRSDRAPSGGSRHPKFL